MKANTKLFIVMALGVAGGLALDAVLQRNPIYKGIVG